MSNETAKIKPGASNNFRWWQQGVVYQIYPRSFQDTNGDGVGDLEGIIQRLDYLNDGTPASLGIDAIWVSPIYPSPMNDFGYDISDYDDIDPLFGNLEIFDRLLAECHMRNIKVLMDLVVNHTSDQHPWFKESSSSQDNPKSDWYLWESPRKRLIFRRPNNWVACLDVASAWWWEEKRKQYYLATFTQQQPELNWRNPDVKDAVYSMISRWFDRGVDGFRLDVINYIIKDDQLRWNPVNLNPVPDMFQEHIYDRNRPESHGVCQELRKIADKAGDRMLVGEIFANDPELVASYYGDDDELHMAFNFAFLYQPWRANSFKDKAVEWYRLLEGKGWPNFTLSNHDQPRHYSRYGAKGDGDARAKVAATMLLTLRGTPFIYYGEEIGMRQAKLKRKEIKDPLGKKLPWMTRDGSRTPMQWSNEPNAGFTSGKPWLPITGDGVSVAAQDKDANSLLNFYRRLIWLRKEHIALVQGDIQFLESDDNSLIYTRSCEGKKAIVVLNFANLSVQTNIAGAENGHVLFSTHRASDNTTTGAVQLSPYEALIIECAS